MPEFDWDSLFGSAKNEKNPSTLDDLIDNASNTTGVPKDLLAALIKQESGGNPKAVGSSGEYGLTQIMQPTWREIQKETGLTDITDPQQQVTGGAYYLGKLIDRYNSVPLGLAAYNTGSGNVDAGRIPKSTKQYVDNILSMSKSNIAAAQLNKYRTGGEQSTAEDLRSRLAELDKKAASGESAGSSGVDWDATFKEMFPTPPLATEDQSSDFWTGLGVLARGVAELPRAAFTSALEAYRGGDIPAQDQTAVDRMITEGRQKAEEYQQKYGIDSKTFLGFSHKDLASLPQNMAYSVVSAIAGLGVGMPTAAAVSLAGTPLAGTAAGYAAGATASGVAAFRMASDQFASSLRDTLNEESVKNRGTAMTEQEWTGIKAAYQDKIDEYGLWEAVPEALSNAMSLGIIRMPVGKWLASSTATQRLLPALAKAGETFAGKLGVTAGKFGAMQTEEHLTETITGYGQGGIEAALGLRKQAPTFWEAFKEQAPQTTLLTTVMGGLGGAGSKLYDRMTKKGLAPTPDNLAPESDVSKRFDEATPSVPLGLPAPQERLALPAPEGPLGLPAPEGKFYGEGFSFEHATPEEQQTLGLPGPQLMLTAPPDDTGTAGGGGTPIAPRPKSWQDLQAERRRAQPSPTVDLDEVILQTAPELRDYIEATRNNVLSVQNEEDAIAAANRIRELAGHAPPQAVAGLVQDLRRQLERLRVGAEGSMGMPVGPVAVPQKDMQQVEPSVEAVPTVEPDQVKPKTRTIPVNKDLSYLVRQLEQAGQQLPGPGTPAQAPRTPEEYLKGKIGEPKQEEAPKGKEPWELTKEEWFNRKWNKLTKKVQKSITAGEKGFASTGEIREQTDNEHRRNIERALSENLPVPPTVLADYPDLVEKYGKKPVPTPPTKVEPEVVNKKAEGKEKVGKKQAPAQEPTIPPDQAAFIAKRVEELGSIESVNKAYDKDDAVSRYARKLAQASYGEKVEPTAEVTPEKPTAEPAVQGEEQPPVGEKKGEPETGIFRVERDDEGNVRGIITALDGTEYSSIWMEANKTSNAGLKEKAFSNALYEWNKRQRTPRNSEDQTKINHDRNEFVHSISGIFRPEGRPEIVATSNLSGTQYDYMILPVKIESGAIAFRVFIRQKGSNIIEQDYPSLQSSVYEDTAENLGVRYRNDDRFTILDPEAKKAAEQRREQDAEKKRERDEEERKVQEDLARMAENDAKIAEVMVGVKGRSVDASISGLKGKRIATIGTVKGKAIGDFAYHRVFGYAENPKAFKDKDTWSVTHIPSGRNFGVPGLTHEIDAKELAYRFSLMGERWDGKGQPPKAFLDSAKSVAKDFVDRNPIQPVAGKGELTEPPEKKGETKEKKQEESTTEDVGEELTYNKRNRIRTGIKWDDIANKNTALKVKEATKQNVYPRPDYAQMIEDGTPPIIAHLVKQVYDSISAKPSIARDATDADLKRYIEAVNRVMDGVNSWVSDKDAIAQWATTNAKTAGAMMGRPTSVMDMAKTANTLLDAVYPDGWKSHRDEVIILGGNKLLRALQPGIQEARKAIKDINGGWPGKQESWQKQGYKVVETGKTVKVSEGTRYSGPAGSVKAFFVEINGQNFDASDTREEAEAKIEGFKPWLILDKYNRIKGHFPTQEAATEGARELVKRESKDKISDKGISVQAAKRIGEARRMEGEDISSDRLKETFGFRGINFGNWLKGKTNEKERQLHLNHAYDSFMDLAEILGIPPDAMSLNGMLGLAIGAQGTGQYAAHFVPGVNEINLTRTSGAGSLAHEFAHALDHYFASMGGLSASSDPFLSEPINHTRTNLDKTLRPEIIARFKAITESMNKRERTQEEVSAVTEVNKTNAKRRVKQWLEAIRKDFESRTNPETVDRFDGLSDKILSLDLGDGHVAIGGKTYISPTVSEMRDLYKKASGRVLSIDNIKGLQSNIDHYAYLNSEKAAERDHLPQMTGTDYARKAWELDKSKGGKRYWSTNLEKFARAFDAFVSDTLEEKAAKNTYLSHAGRSDETVPIGEERKTINKAFSYLISEFKIKEEGGRQVLFRVNESEMPSTPLTRESVLSHFAKIARSWKNRPKIFVVQNESQLPQTYDTSMKGFEGRSYGFYDPTNRVAWFIADNMPSLVEAESTLFHEVLGHHGLREFIGEDFNSFLDKVYDHFGKYGLSAIAKNNGFDLSTKEGQRAAADEKLAEMAQKGTNQNWLQKAWVWVKNWLRGKGFSIKLGYDDFVDTVRRVGEYVKSGNPAYSSEDFRGGIDETTKRLLVEKEEGLNVHSIPITPSMRESVMQGQPLFRLNPEQNIRFALRTPVEVVSDHLKQNLTKQGIDVTFGNTKQLRPIRDGMLRLPYWLSKTNETVRKFFRVEKERMNSRATTLHDDLQETESVFNLDDKQTKEFSDVAFGMEKNGARIQKDDIKVGKFVRVGEHQVEIGKGQQKEVRTIPTYEINEDHYRALENYLKGKGISPAVRQAYIATRKKLDKILLHIHDRMAEMAEIDPSMIAEYRRQIGRINFYFPHNRYGNSYVQVLDANKEVIFRQHFNAVGETSRVLWFNKNKAKIEAKLKELNKDVDLDSLKWKVAKVKGLPEEVYDFPIPVDAMQQIIDAGIARLPEESDKAREALKAAMSEAVSDVMKSRGFGSHMIERKNIPGFERENMQRVLFDYLAGYSGWLTKMDAARQYGKMLGNIDAKKTPNDYSWAVKYTKDMLENATLWDRVADSARGAFFVYYLGANIKTATLNLTQNIVAGVPRLSMDAKGAFSAWAKALKDLRITISEEGIKKSQRFTGEEKKFLIDMLREGWGQARFVSEVTGRIGGPAKTITSKAVRFAGLPMEIAEKYNRMSLGLASFRLARSGKLKKQNGNALGYEASKSFSEEVVEDAHFIYGKGNRPGIFRGNELAKMASTTYTFRTFTHNLMSLWRWMITQNGKEGALAFAYSMGGIILLGGLSAAPFYQTLATLFRQLFGDDYLRKMTRDMVPNQFRDIVSYGMPSMFGVNIGGSLGMEVPILDRYRADQKPSEQMWRGIMEASGIPGSMLTSFFDNVVGGLASGNPSRLADFVLPTAAQNVKRAYELYTYGQYTQTGRPITLHGKQEATKLTGGEALAKTIGFQPVSLTKGYDRYRTQEDAESYKMRHQKAMADAYMRAKNRGDIEGMQKVKNDLKEWNERMTKSGYPQYRIDLKDTIRTRSKPSQVPKPFRNFAKETAEAYQ